MNGEVLKRLRAIYGLSAKEFSQRIDISPSYLSEIENDKKQPTLEILEKYAHLFNFKLSSLILLSENFDDVKYKSKNDDLIRNMMIHLINKMSVGINDEEDT